MFTSSPRKDPVMNAQSSGRSEEFVLLLVQHQREIRSFALTLIPNSHDAEEVVQEGSIVLWRKFGEFQRGTNFLAWALQVVRMVAHNYRRTKGRGRLMFASELMDSLADRRAMLCDDLLQRREALKLCRQKLRAIDDDLLNRYYTQRTTIHELADNLGRPANTVSKALIRIRHALWECIERRLRQEEA